MVHEGPTSTQHAKAHERHKMTNSKVTHTRPRDVIGAPTDKAEGMEPQTLQQSSLIQSIDIDDLFGQFRYRLRSLASIRGDDQLLLLYGDNGAGKSTILNIVFHLLHPEPYEGHRSAAGRIPFRFVKIVLTSGVVVTAEKKDPFDDSSYCLKLTQPHTSTAIEYVWDSERRGREHDDPEYRQYCKILEKFGLAFHFLSDTRRVAGPSKPEENELRIRQTLTRRDRYQLWHTDDGPMSEAEIVVGEAVDRTIEGLRRLALTGTSVGYTSVNTIYEELINRIIEPGTDAEASDAVPIAELRQELTALHERNGNYAKYGLTPKLDTDRLLKLLDRAQESHIEILNTVLKPYFDGHHARLSALESAQKVIDEFVTILSEFFSHKVVGLDVRTGLTISDRNGKRIPPELLFSGERQLVVLLCNTITARKDGTILVIDEPEISLNVKWQRRLISALLSCLEGAETQIILATHSIEILSQYRDYVAPLSELPEQSDD